MRTLSLRTHIRYITFCTVFLLLAVGYGAAFHSVSDTCDILRRSDNLRALASLSEYAEAVRQAAEAFPDNAAQRPEALRICSEAAGGAQHALSVLSMDDASRRHLTRFFSDSSDCFRLLTAREGALNGEERNALLQIAQYASRLRTELSVLLLPGEAKSFSADLTAYRASRPPTLPLAQTVSVSGDAPSISETQARTIARRYLGTNRFLRQVSAEKTVYRLVSGSVYADIRRSDGVLIRLASGKTTGAVRIGRAEARAVAEAFLQDEGIRAPQFSGETVCGLQYFITLRTESGETVHVGVELDHGRVTYYDASAYYLHR